MEVTTDGQSQAEMEQKLNVLQTSLNAVEASIMKFENLLEDCRMVKEEVHHIEEDEACQEEVRHIEEDEAHQEEEEEETANVEMANEEEHSDPESSDPIWRLIPRTSLHWSLVGILSLLRRKLSSCRKHPNLRIQQLDLTAPGVKPPWSLEGYASHPQGTLGLRRMRPRNSSLPFSDVT